MSCGKEQSHIRLSSVMWDRGVLCYQSDLVWDRAVFCGTAVSHETEKSHVVMSKLMRDSISIIWDRAISCGADETELLNYT